MCKQIYPTSDHLEQLNTNITRVGATYNLSYLLEPEIGANYWSQLLKQTIELTIEADYQS